jgi:hypothetical protein
MAQREEEGKRARDYPRTLTDPFQGGWEPVLAFSLPGPHTEYKSPRGNLSPGSLGPDLHATGNGWHLRGHSRPDGDATRPYPLASPGP